SERRGSSTRLSPSCAATRSGSHPVPRSAACSSSSPRSGPQARFRPERRRSTLSAERWVKTAPQIAELEESRRAEFTEHVRRFVRPSGDERALDSGTGTGALAFALAPYVHEVVAVDLVPELLAEGRSRAAAFPNVTFVEGDATDLELERSSF